MEEQITIWKNVANGIGAHGSFLVAFGHAFVAADIENQVILENASRRLIKKYDLYNAKYLSEAI